MSFLPQCSLRRWLGRRALAGYALSLGIWIVAITATLALNPLTLGAAQKVNPAAEIQAPQKTECELNSARGDIKHVIFVEFGSLQFLRDNPNVPSDLEQMPHLLAFLVNNGALLTNHHSTLSLGEANQVSTLLTGLYSQSQGTTTHETTADATNASAPWLPFTRAGCNVGAVAIREMTLENTREDIHRIFGEDSLEAALSAEPKRSAQTAADLEGIAIHCAAGNVLCSDGRPDLPRDKTRGPEGFNALFGYRNVAPALNLHAPLTDLDGHTIADPQGNIGFPGFDAISAAQSLAYAAAMQERGVPVTYTYISSPHQAGKASFGPGEAAYVERLKAYDAAFDKFLTRLAADGIDQDNTLFVVTAEHADHFVGGPPNPATCDGVNIPCAYPKAGAIAANLSDLLVRREPKLAGASFELTPGVVPKFWVNGGPFRGSTSARQVEKTVAKLTAVNPITGSPDSLAAFLASSVELNLLHLGVRDDAHAPDFVMFGSPDYFFTNSGSPSVSQNRAIAWNRVGPASEANTTFVGIVAPGVNVKRIDKDVWSDDADVRPTTLSLLGLTDDYPSQGRVLTEVLHPWALPKGIQDGGAQFVQLAEAYKQINAPLGELGVTSLRISTAALAGDDAKYENLERQLQSISVLRDDLASAIAKLLNAAEFQGRRISEDEARQLVRSANDLTDYVKLVAANGW